MKKSLVAFIVPLSVIGVAHAEPLTVNVGGLAVTLYGTLDGGVWTQSKATSNAAGAPAVGPVSAGGVTRFHSGGIAPSKWGLTGSKDLGDGVKASFRLEEHITAGTGATNAFGYPGFARQAFVGLSGKFGTVQIGEQFTPALLAYAATDPRGLRESLSGLQPWILSTNFANRTSSAVLDAFTHNALAYAVDVSKVHLAAHYAMGGVAGTSSGSSNWSLGASYAGMPVTLSGGYQESNGVNGSKASVKSSVGAGFSSGPFKFKINYLNSKQYNLAGAESANYKITGIGADWKATGKQTINLSYYDGRNTTLSDNKAGTWVLSDEYAFAPNITLYVQLAMIDAKRNADMAVSLLGTTNLVQGAKTTVLNAGVSFNF